MRTKLEIWAPCHPERSEGSALVRISRFDRSRFFVASLLRMTRRASVAQSDFLSNDRAGRQAWPRRAAVEDGGSARRWRPPGPFVSRPAPEAFESCKWRLRAVALTANR